jgi:hypothetical protein
MTDLDLLKRRKRSMGPAYRLFYESKRNTDTLLEKLDQALDSV